MELFSSRQRLLVNQSRCEGVYNRTGDVNAAFDEKGGARKRAEVFVQTKTEQSGLCPPMVRVSIGGIWNYFQIVKGC